MRKDLDLMRGAIDLHVHSRGNIEDDIKVALAARDRGMKAVLFKQHFLINPPYVSYVDKSVPGISCFGGVTLNYTVGGLNPYAVEASISFGGKEVWMPTFHSTHHVLHAETLYGGHKHASPVRAPERGISILRSGELVPEVIEILQLIAEADVILGTSHLMPEETSVLVDEAKNLGVKKILVTHPHHFPMSLEQQIELTRKGAYLEYLFVYVFYNRLGASFDGLVKKIKMVGAENCVLGTDTSLNGFQHVGIKSPAEALSVFVSSLMERGLSEKEINMMLKDNPEKLLDLKD